MCFYKSSACYSYFNKENLKIAGIYTILSFYYELLLTSEKRTYLNHEKIKCFINDILEVHYKNYNSSKDKFKKFIKKCYGTQKTKRDAVKAKINRRGILREKLENVKDIRNL